MQHPEGPAPYTQAGFDVRTTPGETPAVDLLQHARGTLELLDDRGEESIAYRGVLHQHGVLAHHAGVRGREACGGVAQRVVQWRPRVEMRGEKGKLQGMLFQQPTEGAAHSVPSGQEEA